jgi:hypothetical protein
MITFISIIFLIIVLFALFWRISIRHSKGLVIAAEKAELKRDFKNATYLYAAALANYYKPSDICRTRIRELWKSYGPFDYYDELEKFKVRNDQDANGDRDLFIGTWWIIEQVVEGYTEKHSYDEPNQFEVWLGKKGLTNF